MFVQKEHPRLKRHGNLLLGGGRLAMVRVKDGLAADAALGGGREVEEEGPGRPHGDGGWFRGEGERVGVVVYVFKGWEEGKDQLTLMLKGFFFFIFHRG